MGPGMGAVLARAGIETALYDMSAEALERAKAGVALAQGVLDRLDAPSGEGGSVRFETDLAAALEGAEVVVEAVPENLELKHAGLPRVREARRPPTPSWPPTPRASRSPAIAEVCDAPRAGGGHALVQPAAPHPDDRGHPRRAHRPRPSSRPPCALVAGDRLPPGRSRRRCPASSRTASSTRSCASAWTWWTGASSTRRRSTSTCAGASATSWRSSARWQLLDMAGMDIYDAVGTYLNQDLSTAPEVSSDGART